MAIFQQLSEGLEMVSIGTLLAFVIVCAGVWIIRRRRSDLARPFRTPLVHSGPNPRNRNVTNHDVKPDRGYLDPVGCLADDWDGDLFQLQPASQPRTA